MSTNSHHLTPIRIHGEVRLPSHEHTDKTLKITEDSPAISVMTDFTLVEPFHIQGSASLKEVNDTMVAAGVRLLFVQNKEGELTGLLTSLDLLGEKPLLFIQNGGGKRSDIEAKNIMTPISELEGIVIKKVEESTVADVIEACRDSHRHHLLVVETRDNYTYIRGLISSSHVARIMNVEISPSQRAESFADLNRSLT